MPPHVGAAWPPVLTTRRETAVAGVGGLAAAVAMKAPALYGLGGHRLPKDLVDPLYQSWQLAWGAHALLNHPLSPWNSNIFWPLARSFAFNDTLYGYSPIGAVFGSGPTAAVIRYAALFLLAYALAAAGTYLLARQLGCRPLTASVAAGIYAFAPWHLAQDGHLNVLSNGAVPLSLALLARGHGVGARGSAAPARPWCALAGWLVAAWQVTVTLVAGLQLAYVLGSLILVTAVLAASGRWRPPAGRERALLTADLVGVAVFAGVVITLAQPYLAVTKAHPQSLRSVNDVRFFSPPLWGFLIAPGESVVWGAAHAGARSDLRWPGEQAMSVGALTVLMATYGVLAGTWSRGRRLWLSTAAVLVLLLGAGTSVAGGRLFLLLLEHAPGWRSVRTPGRLVILLALVLALLAANGAEALLRRVARPQAWGIALVGLVLLEGLGTLPVPRVPPPSPGLAAASAPALILPSDDVQDTQAIWASTAGFPPIVNGVTGFTPQFLAEVRRRALGFPDPASVAFLRRAGVRSVVLRATQSSGTPWAGAEARSIDGLGLTVRAAGGDLVYDLVPGRT